MAGAIDRKEGDRGTTRNCSHSTDPAYYTPTYGLGGAAGGQQSGDTAFLQGSTTFVLSRHATKVRMARTRVLADPVRTRSSQHANTPPVSWPQVAVHETLVGKMGSAHRLKARLCGAILSAPLTVHTCVASLATYGVLHVNVNTGLRSTLQAQTRTAPHVYIDKWASRQPPPRSVLSPSIALQACRLPLERKKLRRQTIVQKLRTGLAIRLRESTYHRYKTKLIHLGTDQSALQI